MLSNDIEPKPAGQICPTTSAYLLCESVEVRRRVTGTFLTVFTSNIWTLRRGEQPGGRRAAVLGWKVANLLKSVKIWQVKLQIFAKNVQFWEIDLFTKKYIYFISFISFKSAFLKWKSHDLFLIFLCWLIWWLYVAMLNIAIFAEISTFMTKCHFIFQQKVEREIHHLTRKIQDLSTKSFLIF